MLSQKLNRDIGDVTKYRHFKLEKKDGIVILSRKEDAVAVEWVIM